jgi:hypothetical protein
MLAHCCPQLPMNHDAPRIVVIFMTNIHVVVEWMCISGLETVRIGGSGNGRWVLSLDACLNLLSGPHYKTVCSPEQILLQSPKLVPALYLRRQPARHGSCLRHLQRPSHSTLLSRFFSCICRENQRGSSDSATDHASSAP